MKTGTPVISSLAEKFPTDRIALTTNNQFFIGDSLMVVAVNKRSELRYKDYHNVTTVNVYLPPGLWVNGDTREVISSDGSRTYNLEFPLEKLPYFFYYGENGTNGFFALAPVEVNHEVNDTLSAPLRTTKDINNNRMHLWFSIPKGLATANHEFYWDDGISKTIRNGYELETIDQVYTVTSDSLENQFIISTIQADIPTIETIVFYGDFEELDVTGVIDVNDGDRALDFEILRSDDEYRPVAIRVINLDYRLDKYFKIVFLTSEN